MRARRRRRGRRGRPPPARSPGADCRRRPTGSRACRPTPRPSAAPTARGARPGRPGCRPPAGPAAACRSPSRTRLNSSSTSSRRSCAPSSRSRASSSATSPTGSRLNAVRSVIRGGIGSAGICEVTCSSMKRDASHTRSASTPCSRPRPGQRVAQHLGGHPVQRVGDRAARRWRSARRRAGRPRSPSPARFRPCPGSRGRPARRPPPPAASIDLVAGARVERAGRVVQQHVVGAQLGQPARLVDHPRQVRHVAREGQAGVQAAARLAHGRRRRGEVLDVVQRVVQPEDLDAALGGAEDEAAHQVVGQRPRADQEPAAQRHLQRRLASSARLSAADPLPRALDCPAGRRRRSSRRRSPRARRSRRWSRISATSSTRAVEIVPTSGCCESRRIVVSTMRVTRVRCSAPRACPPGSRRRR